MAASSPLVSSFATKNRKILFIREPDVSGVHQTSGWPRSRIIKQTRETFRDIRVSPVSARYLRLGKATGRVALYRVSCSIKYVFHTLVVFRPFFPSPILERPGNSSANDSLSSGPLVSPCNSLDIRATYAHAFSDWR